MEEKNIGQIKKKEIFKNKTDYINYAILSYLNTVDLPTGSWTLQNYLKGIGINTSLATIGRILQSLDNASYTFLDGTQGRIITDEGRAYYNKKSEDIRLYQLFNQLCDSVKIDSIKKFMDLFNVRIMLETEVVKMATILAKQEDLNILNKLVEEVKINAKNCVLIKEINTQFHKEIFRITGNPFLVAIEDILMSKQWELEDENVEVVGGYHNNVCERYHRMIVSAMTEGNLNKVAEIMRNHLESLRDDAIKSIEIKTLK